MRTTLDIDDNLLILARKRAKDEGRTLTSVVEGALQLALFCQPAAASEPEKPWEPVILPGKLLVDPADREALWALFDEEDGWV
jgi:hypothetical protein